MSLRIIFCGFLLTLFPMGALKAANEPITKDECEHELISPFTCTDILFGEFPMTDSPFMNLIFTNCYNYCLALFALEDEYKRGSDKQKKMIKKDIANIRSLLDPSMVSFRVGLYVFKYTNLQDDILKAIENNLDRHPCNESFFKE